MKRKYIFLYAVLLDMLTALAACSDKDDRGIRTELSLYAPQYTLGNNEGDSVQIAIVTEGKALSTVRIPYRLSSVNGAKLNEDFTLSDSAFTLQEGDSVAYLTITRKKVEAQKSFLLTLMPVEGVKLGALNYIQVDLMGANVNTFLDPTDMLALSKDYTIRLETALGERYSYTKQTRLAVEVVPSSTAVPGEHFRFANDRAQAVFKAGQSDGVVSLQFLKLEKGKDHIVLRLADSNKLVGGNNPTIDIRIVGPSDFAGTWEFVGVGNKNWWTDSWGMDTDLIVDGSSADRIKLEGTPETGYNFTPMLTGKLKNYFVAACRAPFKGERENYFQEAGGRPPKISLAEYEFETINVAFSETDTNNRKALVGLRFIQDEKKQRLLEMSIYDFEPTETNWNGLMEMMKYSASEPPYFLDGPIRIHWKLVQ